MLPKKFTASYALVSLLWAFIGACASPPVKTKLGIISEDERLKGRSILNRLRRFNSRNLESGTFIGKRYYNGDVGNCIPISSYDSAFLSTVFKENRLAFKTVVPLVKARGERRLGDGDDCKGASWCDDRWLAGLYIYYGEKCNYDDPKVHRFSVYLGTSQNLGNLENIIKGIHDQPFDESTAMAAFDNGNGYTGYSFEGRDILELDTNDRWTQINARLYVAYKGDTLVAMKMWGSNVSYVNEPIFALSIVPKFAERQKEAHNNAVRFKGPCEDLTSVARKSCEEAEQQKAIIAAEQYRQKNADEKWLRELGVPKGPAAESCSTSYSTQGGVQTATTTCRRW